MRDTNLIRFMFEGVKLDLFYLTHLLGPSPSTNYMSPESDVHKVRPGENFPSRPNKASKSPQAQSVSAYGPPPRDWLPTPTQHRKTDPDTYRVRWCAASKLEAEPELYPAAPARPPFIFSAVARRSPPTKHKAQHSNKQQITYDRSVYSRRLRRRFDRSYVEKMALQPSFNPFTLLERNDPGDNPLSKEKEPVAYRKPPVPPAAWPSMSAPAPKKKNDDKKKKNNNNSKNKKKPQEAGKGAANAAAGNKKPSAVKKEDTAKYIGYQYRAPIRTKKPDPEADKKKEQEAAAPPPSPPPPPPRPATPPPSFDDAAHFPTLGKNSKKK